MDDLFKRSLDHEKAKSIIVWKSDRIVKESYSADSGADMEEPINSITKTIVSLLLGMAIDSGYIGGVDEDIRNYIPKAKENTLEEHLTMTSGMDWGVDLIREPYNEELVNSASWISYICSKEILPERRGEFKYNGGSSHLIGKAIAVATGMRLEDFAKEKLFASLGIKFSESLEEIRYNLSNFSWNSGLGWDRDPEGNNIGSFGLRLKAMDLIAIGQLILNRGAFNGEQIVSKDYVDSMVRPRVKAGLLDYGYHIWVRKIRGVETISALGYGNQYLTILPKHDAVIVMLSENDGADSIELEKLHGELVKASSRI